MEIYSESDEKGLELVEHIPFPSEEDLEELLFSNKSLLGDLYAFARQAKSGSKRNIADILAVDDNGMIYVVEVKNVRPRGEEVVLQALRYVDWVKRNPSEIKLLWQEWTQSHDEESIIPEPDWNSRRVGTLLVAPSFDSSFVKMILNAMENPLRFLTVNKYKIGDKEIIVANQLDQLEQYSTEQKGIPSAKPDYSWETYLKTATNEVGLKQARQLHEQTLEILKDIELDWLEIRFNKDYVVHKNGGRNVIELYFNRRDKLPGLAFHMVAKPSTLNLELPEGVISATVWNKEYKIAYIPVSTIGVSVKDLKPLFLEAKKYRG